MSKIIYAIPNDDNYVFCYLYEGDIQLDRFGNKIEVESKNDIKDDNGGYLYKVVDGEVVETTDDEKAKQLRSIKYNEIDSLYKSHIYSEYPIEKQNKYGFYFSSLLDKRLNGEELTDEETAKVNELRKLHKWYTLQIENCGALQEGLDDMSYGELKNYVPEVVA